MKSANISLHTTAQRKLEHKTGDGDRTDYLEDEKRTSLARAARELIVIFPRQSKNC